MADSPQFQGWRYEPPAPSVARKITTILLPENFTDQQWLKLLAKEEKDALVIFLKRSGETGFSVCSYGPKDSDNRSGSPLDESGLKVVASALLREMPDLKAVVLDTDSSEHRFEPAALSTEHFSPRRFWSRAGLDGRIKMKNAASVESLSRQLRSPLGVIPFVGAGMSAPFKFPQWEELLLEIVDGSAIESDVRSLIEAGDYEHAAEILDRHRPGHLPLRIRDAFYRDIEPELLRSEAISYLPFLSRGPVITTNFDRVLEQTFKAAGRPFEMDDDPAWGVISGPLSEATVLAIHQNQRVLLKIHGDCGDPTFRVFTVEEYERNYGGQASAASSEQVQPVNVGTLAWLTFTNRPLLFLGCSLDKDRTVVVLKEIHRRLPTLTHYVVMQADCSLQLWETREKDLEGMGIRRPLWFPSGAFSQLKEILRDLLELISMRRMRLKSHVSRREPRSIEPEAAIERFRAAVQTPSTGGATTEKILPTDADLGLFGNLVADKLLENKIIFFLGAGANLFLKSPGDAFYERLTQKFGVPSLPGGRAAVAAYVASQHGSKELWSSAKEFIADQPSGMVHGFLAALPGFLRATRQFRALPLWVLTSNYDTHIEQALDDAGEPFYLLYYLGGTNPKSEGLFALRDPDGSLQIIEQPHNVRGLRQSDVHVVVKLNGGIVHGGGLPESVVIAPAHFERSAALMSSALPEFLREALLDKFLLFLGHGLAEPDAQEMSDFQSKARLERKAS